jgi:hypothetical protein
MIEILGPQIEEFGPEVPRPLGNSIDGLPRNKQVPQQQQHHPWCIHFGALVFRWQMAGKEFLQSHPSQQPVDDRQGTHGMCQDRMALELL